MQETYPRHILVPLEKDIRYLSSLGLSIHRSGTKFRGSGNMVVFMFIVRESILTSVPAGIDHSFSPDLSL